MSKFNTLINALQFCDRRITTIESDLIDKMSKFETLTGCYAGFLCSVLKIENLDYVDKKCLYNTDKWGAI